MGLEIISRHYLLAFIDALAKNALGDNLTVMVLDNAKFHTSSKVKEKRPLWEEKGVFLRYLPPYAPHETVKLCWGMATGDMITAPRFLEGNKVRRFDLVVTTPPFGSVTSWDFGGGDRYQRFLFGDVSGRRADYAFIQHALASINADGRGAVVVASGALRRSGYEQRIRENIVRSGVLDACIGLPQGSFYASPHPGVALIFDLGKTARERQDIFVIDAKRPEEQRGKGRGQVVTQALAGEVIAAYHNRQDVPGFACSVDFAALKSTKYDLVPATYVEPVHTEHEGLDLTTLKKKIAEGERELASASRRFDEALATLEKDSS